MVAEDGQHWIENEEGSRITTFDGNTKSVEHDYLVHAANVLPQLVAAIKNLNNNWERNLTEPMAQLNEGLHEAEFVNIEERKT